MVRRNLLRQILCGALLGSVAHVPAAHADDAGSWLSQWLWVDFKKPNKTHGFQLWLDLHERAWGSNFLAIFRPGLGYDIGHGLTFWGGYAFIPSLTANTPDSNRYEHRIWEQFIVTEKVKTVALQGRIRLEQRFRDGNDGVGERLRIFGRAGFFFGQHAPWGWAVWDEVLINLNETTLWASGFDQNRFFTGPFYQAPSGVRIEFGYFNFLVNRRDTGLYDSHIAMMNLYIPVQAFHKAEPPRPAPVAEPAPPPPPPSQLAPATPPPGPPPAAPAAPQPTEQSPAPAVTSPNVESDLWDPPS